MGTVGCGRKIGEFDCCTVVEGDCLMLLQQLSEAMIDMVLCDPPYGTTKCKWDIVLPFESLWPMYDKVVKSNTPILIFGTEPFSSLLRNSNLGDFRYDWYWQKDKAANFLFGNKMPLKVIEIVSVFYSEQPTYNPQKEMNPKGASKRHLSPNPSKITNNVREVMGDLWKETEMDATQNYHGKNYEPDKLLPKQLVYCAREQRGKQHPTQKPVALLEYFINTYTNINEFILDNCCGSGSTLVAAKKLGRHFLGIEIEPKYVEIARQRLVEIPFTVEVING